MPTKQQFMAVGTLSLLLLMGTISFGLLVASAYYSIRVEICLYGMFLVDLNLIKFLFLNLKMLNQFSAIRHYDDVASACDFGNDHSDRLSGFNDYQLVIEKLR